MLLFLVWLCRFKYVKHTDNEAWILNIINFQLLENVDRGSETQIQVKN